MINHIDLLEVLRWLIKCIFLLCEQSEKISDIKLSDIIETIVIKLKNYHDRNLQTFKQLFEVIEKNILKIVILPAITINLAPT